jgi:hypothetical protein
LGAVIEVPIVTGANSLGVGSVGAEGTGETLLVIETDLAGVGAGQTPGVGAVIVVAILTDALGGLEHPQIGHSAGDALIRVSGGTLEALMGAGSTDRHTVLVVPLVAGTRLRCLYVCSEHQGRAGETTLPGVTCNASGAAFLTVFGGAIVEVAALIAHQGPIVKAVAAEAGCAVAARKAGVMTGRTGQESVLEVPILTHTEVVLDLPVEIGLALQAVGGVQAPHTV